MDSIKYTVELCVQEEIRSDGIIGSQMPYHQILMEFENQKDAEDWFNSIIECNERMQ